MTVATSGIRLAFWLKASLAGLLAVTLSSCEMNSVAAAQSEDEIRRLLPGTWHTELRLGGDVIWTEKTFFANGTAKGFLLVRAKESGVAIYLPKINFTSRWRLVGHRITIYDMRSVESDFLDPEEVHHDRILSISPTQIKYQDFAGDRIVYDRGPLR